MYKDAGVCPQHHTTPGYDPRNSIQIQVSGFSVLSTSGNVAHKPVNLLTNTLKRPPLFPPIEPGNYPSRNLELASRRWS